MHPYETQHTFQEIYTLLHSLNFKVISTSINMFREIDDINNLFEYEKKLYEVSIEKNTKQKTYYPGFFTTLAKRIK